MTKFVYDVNVESHINYWKLTIKVCDSFWWLLTVHFPTYLKGILNGGYINATYTYIDMDISTFTNGTILQQKLIKILYILKEGKQKVDSKCKV